MNELDGQRFLITGATGGAGGATAHLLASKGASLTLMQGRDLEATEKARRALPGGPHNILVQGVYNGIFHAAGIEHVGPLGNVSRETWGRVAEPSVELAVDILRDVAARKDSILRDGGAIVMMSSVAAVCGTAGMGIYAATKGAVEALCRCAAVELAPRRIRVNCVRAGGFTGPMHTRILDRLTEKGLNDYAARHPIGFGTSQDIANTVAWLLSDAAKWVTGSMVTVDGGYSCV